MQNCSLLPIFVRDVLYIEQNERMEKNLGSLIPKRDGYSEILFFKVANGP